jgi:UDP-2,3-diacylglucosamine pyrophosphatase LpxH
MLVVISDLHLGDNTCSKTISPDAFRIFKDRLEELLLNASIREGETYHPIERVELLLLGDILELIHSTLWLSEKQGEAGYARPWSDPQGPELPAKVLQITRAILKENAEGLTILREMTGETPILLPPANSAGKPALDTLERIPVNVHVHYMVGNHDWLYHLPGEGFDQARQEVIRAMGLANKPGPFPYDPGESETLMRLCDEYRIFARHGDYFDTFNYDHEKGRNTATLGDALGIDLLNRFPDEVEKRMGDLLPEDFYHELHEITNIRPSVAAPLWISSKMREYGGNPAERKQIKDIWNEVTQEFIKLDFVRAHDKATNPFDSVDGLELALKLTRRASLETLNQVVLRLQKKLWSDELSLARFAVTEAAFTSHRANYIIYGHTHNHELVPLDTYQAGQEIVYQFMVNSGTWRAYHGLTRYRPEEQKFIPYQLMTYLAFYKANERKGRRFEAWSGKLI